ncbi:hypothetical protein [Streptomyces sp. NPDC048581]|uniref:hypothetical protein n=1 Tax=unclassified Streptomyces TaxID=2593676 RepID=UPI003721921C
MTTPPTQTSELRSGEAWYVPMPSKQEPTAPAQRLLADRAPDGSFVLTPYQAGDVTIHDDVRRIGAWARVSVHSDQEPPPPLVPYLPSEQDQRPRRVPEDVALALNARAVLVDDRAEQGKGNPLASEIVNICLTNALCLPKSERWQQAVSDALLGDWVAPLVTEGRLTRLAVATLKAEARSIHRQLVPLWRRGTRKGRTLSLDFPLGDDVSLHDLIATRPSAVAPTPCSEPDDVRLAALLRALTADERRVVHAWAQHGIDTWADAAWYAGAADPEVTGEQVRRRVRYLIAEQDRRRAQQLPGATPCKGSRS